MGKIVFQLKLRLLLFFSGIWLVLTVSLGIVWTDGIHFFFLFSFEAWPKLALYLAGIFSRLALNPRSFCSSFLSAGVKECMTVLAFL